MPILRWSEIRGCERMASVKTSWMKERQTPIWMYSIWRGYVRPTPVCIMLGFRQLGFQTCLEIHVAAAAIDLPNFIQILPKLKFTRITTNLLQVRRQKHLPMFNLRTILLDHLGNWSFVTRASRRERSCCDIVCEEFLVHDVHHGRDELFDVFRAGHESVDISLGEIEK